MSPRAAGRCWSRRSLSRGLRSPIVLIQIGTKRLFLIFEVLRKVRITGVVLAQFFIVESGVEDYRAKLEFESLLCAQIEKLTCSPYIEWRLIELIVIITQLAVSIGQALDKFRWRVIGER